MKIAAYAGFQGMIYSHTGSEYVKDHCCSMALVL